MVGDKVAETSSRSGVAFPMHAGASQIKLCSRSHRLYFSDETLFQGIVADALRVWCLSAKPFLSSPGAPALRAGLVGPKLKSFLKIALGAFSRLVADGSR